MQFNYYPWKVTTLVDWLKDEVSIYGSMQALSKRLAIPPQILNQWLRGLNSHITFSQIQAIAKYRGWSLQATSDWLEIRPAHWQEILNQQERSA